MFPHTVTLYNHYTQDGKDCWRRTVLRGVLWDETEGVTRRRTGVDAADGLRLIVPFTAPCDSRYLSPGEYAKRRKKAGVWTLREGDSVVKGDVPYEIIRSSAELAQYDHVYQIAAVVMKDFGGGMAHWEVTGK